MAEYEKYLNDLGYSQDIVRLADEILKLRQMLWLNHGHSGQYGDDGEMQCGQCTREYGFYDWKRTPIEEIQSKMFEGNMKKLAEAAIYCTCADEPEGQQCAHCQETRHRA